ncbi:universal stress protein [Acidaminobacter hydrogenoformans]|uniref:Nucleotide-binding universal stress protein, UspA family n=1 Tax=Acidaminobacter hydrogenoformans DSM 2784 TaxID=1120920 RepID=A0A1G5RXC7_9FIRM|nr:universal stress protein [Acidaminobacter hydrogenoformans]SCZ78111.1 Nucleotide-binding universal stress protein, UspA family [Acidaminobacter hydrogenoformans DSM 2784]
MRKLLVPIDSNTLPDSLKKLLEDFVAVMDYEVTLIYVTPISRNQVHGDLMAFREENEALFEDLAKNMLSEVEAELKAVGIERIQKVHVMGDPAEEILKFAEAGEFHSIAMNSRGMSAVKRLLIGSVTNKIVHHATIPVIVVK